MSSTPEAAPPRSSGSALVWVLFVAVTVADAALLGWIGRQFHPSMWVTFVQSLRNDPLVALFVLDALALRVGAVMALAGGGGRLTFWLALVPAWGAPFLFADILQRRRG